MSSSSAEPPTSGPPAAHPDQDDDGSSKEEHGADDLSMSKKGQPWTTEEHLAFLSGLKRMGKGNWRGISKHFVPSRTPTQVASHAQKHFMRLQGVTKRKSRFSALEQEVMGTVSTAQKAAGGPATPSSSTSPTLPAASFPAMPFPCMMPPMMFAFPGAPMMPPMMYPPPAAMAAMAAMAAKQGFVMPMGMFPSFPGMPMGMPMAMPAMYMHHAHAAAAAAAGSAGTTTPAAAAASTPTAAAPQQAQQQQRPDSPAAMVQQQARQPQPKESSPAAGTNTSVVVVCKPEAQHVLAERDGISLGVGLLDKLRSAKEANSALQPSTHSAFRPPGEVRAGAS